MTERHGVILSLEEEGGRVGYGESAPWPGFGLETLASSRAALALAAKRLIGLPAESYIAAAADLSRLAPVAAAPCARHAIDLALHDLAAQAAGIPIARLLGGDAALPEVPVNAAIPRLGPAEAEAEARRAVESGFRTIKVKVGGGPIEEDVARVGAVRGAAGPNVRIRVDANQSWSEPEAIRAIAALGAFSIEYVEQPVAALDLEGLARVRAAAGGTAIAADEAVRDLAGARRILAAKAADVWILKPMALGGLEATRRIAALAREHGVEVVVTSLLESPVGVTGALHLAASLGPARHAHGLGTTARVSRGAAAVPGGPGLGVRFDSEAPAEQCLAEAV